MLEWLSLAFFIDRSRDAEVEESDRVAAHEVAKVKACAGQVCTTLETHNYSFDLHPHAKVVPHGRS